MRTSPQGINTGVFRINSITNMSAKIKKNIDAIRVLKRASPKLRKAIISNSKPELIRALCEIITNVVAGTVKLNTKDKKKLSHHKLALRTLADKKVSVNKKKQILVQNGGFLSALLIPALTLLGSIIGSKL